MNSSQIMKINSEYDQKMPKRLEQCHSFQNTVKKNLRALSYCVYFIFLNLPKE